MAREALPPIEAWNALVDFVEDADMARIDAMSDEELDAELIAAGLGTKDPKVRHYGVGYPLSEIEALPPPPQSGPSVARSAAASSEPAEAYEPERVVDITSARRGRAWNPWSVMLAAAAILVTVTLGAGAVIALRERRAPPGPDRMDVPVRGPELTDDQRLAADLRRNATEACDQRDWSRCLSEADRAKELDPAGDPAMQGDRMRAMAGIRAELEMTPKTDAEKKEKRKGSGK